MVKENANDKLKKWINFIDSKEELIKFVLCDSLQEIDELGLGHVYEAVEHPTAKDLMVVQFKEDGEWYTSNYTKQDLETKFKEGVWIRV